MTAVALFRTRASHRTSRPPVVVPAPCWRSRSPGQRTWNRLHRLLGATLLFLLVAVAAVFSGPSAGDDEDVPLPSGWAQPAPVPPR